MTHFSYTDKSMLKTTSGVVLGAVLTIGLISSIAFAQQALSAEELKAHIEKQQVALDAAIANRDKTQQELEAKRLAFEAQSTKQAEIETRMKELCEEQEAVLPGSMENCMSGKTTK